MFSNADNIKDGFKKAITGSNDAETAVKGLDAATQSASKSMGILAKNMKEAFNPGTILKETAQLQDLSFKFARESMGNASMVGDALTATMAEAYYQTTEFGVSLDENLNLVKQINEAMQVNTLLTAKQVVNMQLLAKNAGLTSAEIVPIVKGFADVGRSTDYAIEQISKMEGLARSYGINAGQFIKLIGDNVKYLSSYNFKDGVEGLSRMVAKAQALRIDVGKTFSLAEGLMEPEKAIETAAGFQMLGGAVGDLGDPFKLLHMAQTDAEGLQDSIIGMAESAVVFNEKTGEFDIPVTEMYRLREAAKLTGMDYQELTQTAMKAAERTKKLDMLGPMNRYTDEQKEMIANLGEIQDGKVMITLPDEDDEGNEILKAFDATKLGPEQLQKLREQQENANKTDKQIALDQLSALEVLKAAADKSGAIRVVMGTRTGAINEGLDVQKGLGKQLSEELDTVFSVEQLDDYSSALTTAIKTGFEDTEMLKQVTGRFTGDVLSAVKELPNEINKQLSDTSLYKDVDFSKMANVFGFSLTEAFGEGLNLPFEQPVDYIISGGQGTEQGTEQGNPIEADDFILRPNREPILYDENDLIIGGTKLIDALNLQMSNITSNQNDGMFDTNILNPILDGLSNIDVQENSDNIQSNSNIDMLSNIFSRIDNINQQTGNNQVNGDVNLNVNGKIDLTVDGRNLPQNISSEQLANEIVKNPEFTSKLMNIFTDANNTYSA